MQGYWRDMNMHLGRFMTPAVRMLLLANVAVFLLYVVLGSLMPGTMGFLFFLLMQTPYLVVNKLCVWQLGTYMFMHANFMHLFFNMLILWFFASRLERRWGTTRFLKFYFIVGIGAGLFHLVTAYPASHALAQKMAELYGETPGVLQFFEAYLQRAPVYPMLGASGALYGILLAYALYYPNDMVLVYFIFPVKIKWLVLFLGVFTFFASFGSGGGISHITHLGGLVVALLYLKGPEWWNRRGRGGRGGGRRPRRARVEPIESWHPDYR